MYGPAVGTVFWPYAGDPYLGQLWTHCSGLVLANHVQAKYGHSALALCWPAMSGPAVETLFRPCAGDPCLGQLWKHCSGPVLATHAWARSGNTVLAHHWVSTVWPFTAGPCTVHVCLSFWQTDLAPD